MLDVPVRCVQGAVSGLHMAAAFNKAGLPPGLLQVITGKGSEIGDYLTQHPKADCISFTGGDTGLKISAKAGMVPLQMELGGKDVCLVCADADLALTAKSIIKGGLSYQGQRCTAVKVCTPAPPPHAQPPHRSTRHALSLSSVRSSRYARTRGAHAPAWVRNKPLLRATRHTATPARPRATQVVMVVDSVADKLVELLREGVAKLSVGKPEDDCDICHVISKASADWIEELVMGARAACDCRWSCCPCLARPRKIPPLWV